MAVKFIYSLFCKKISRKESLKQDTDRWLLTLFWKKNSRHSIGWHVVSTGRCLMALYARYYEPIESRIWWAIYLTQWCCQLAASFMRFHTRLFLWTHVKSLVYRTSLGRNNNNKINQAKQKKSGIIPIYFLESSI